MASSGKQLEALVAFVEKMLLPAGFVVKTNECVFGEDGVQIAEFDIEIRGKVGTTEMAWLIECRDRPSHGAAPGAWIEQLVGRKIRFGFNKVTAVSTTGFASGAVEYASQQGIELREVAQLAPSSFNWLQLEYMTHHERLHVLNDISFFISETETEARGLALWTVISTASLDKPILKVSNSALTFSPLTAFVQAVAATPPLFEGVEANGICRPVTLHVDYDDDNDHFVVETHAGPVRVVAIKFAGELSIVERKIPISDTSEYRHVWSGETISQVVAFDSCTVLGNKFSVEMHRLSETSQTYVVVHNLSEIKK